MEVIEKLGFPCPEHTDHWLEMIVKRFVLSVHIECPIEFSGQYGSVQRTGRRNRSLKDDDEVLAVMEEAGIDPERVLGVDQDKVDDALEVTEMSEAAVYEIEEHEYVRKARSTRT